MQHSNPFLTIITLVVVVFFYTYYFDPQEVQSMIFKHSMGECSLFEKTYPL